MSTVLKDRGDRPSIKDTGMALPRGPTQPAASEEVDMEVPNRLATVPSLIHNEPVAVLVQSKLCGHTHGQTHQIAPDRGLGTGGIIGTREVPGGDDQHVHRRLRVEVVERHRRL